MAPPTTATNNKDFNRMATSIAGIRCPSLVEIRLMGPPCPAPDRSERADGIVVPMPATIKNLVVDNHDGDDLILGLDLIVDAT